MMGCGVRVQYRTLSARRRRRSQLRTPRRMNRRQSEQLPQVIDAAVGLCMLEEAGGLITEQSVESNGVRSGRRVVFV